MIYFVVWRSKPATMPLLAFLAFFFAKSPEKSTTKWLNRQTISWFRSRFRANLSKLIPQVVAERSRVTMASPGSPPGQRWSPQRDIQCIENNLMNAPLTQSAMSKDSVFLPTVRMDETYLKKEIISEGTLWYSMFSLPWYFRGSNGQAVQRSLPKIGSRTCDSQEKIKKPALTTAPLPTPTPQPPNH